MRRSAAQDRQSVALELIPKNENPVKNWRSAAMDPLADTRDSARAVEMGQEIVPRAQQTAEALGAYHKAEIEKWGPVVEAVGIKAQSRRRTRRVPARYFRTIGQHC